METQEEQDLYIICEDCKCLRELCKNKRGHKFQFITTKDLQGVCKFAEKIHPIDVEAEFLAYSEKLHKELRAMFETKFGELIASLKPRFMEINAKINELKLAALEYQERIQK